MIKYLSVKNFALIEDLQMDFPLGFQVLIGESGSGKSMLLDAIASLVGGRCSVQNVRQGKERYSLFAEFFVESDEKVRFWLEENGFPWNQGVVTISRELTREGKSRIFIQDSLASLALLKDLGQLLCEIHNQNEQLFLLDRSNQLEFIDRFAGLSGMREEMAASFQVFRKLKKSLEEWESREAERKKRFELLTYHIGEFESLNPKENELEELVNEEKVLAMGEKLQEALATIRSHLEEGEDSILSRMSGILAASARISEYQPRFDPIHAEFEQIFSQLKEIRSSVREEEEDNFYSPDRLDGVQARIQDLLKLQKKHNRSIPEIIREYPAWIQERNDLENTRESMDSLRVEYTKTLDRIKSLSLDLSRKRRGVLQDLEEAIQKELEVLGMKGARIQIVLKWEENPQAGDIVEGEKSYILHSTGLDHAEYYFSANPGEKPRPLRKIASGGEMSRIMLAIRTVLGKTYSSQKLIIFDEIDTGISGDAAVCMADRLQKLGAQNQILAITHSQSIASKASHHWKVEKTTENGKVRTEVRYIPESEKAYELARMVSGSEVTQSAMEHAKEILKKAG